MTEEATQKKTTRGPSKYVLRLNEPLVAKLVKQKGYSNNADLARVIGKSRAAVSLWLRGSGVPLEMVEKMADVLGTTVGNILSDETKGQLKSLLQDDKNLVITLPRKIAVDKILVPADAELTLEEMKEILILLVDLITKELDSLDE